MKSRNSKLLPVLRAMDAFTAPAQPEPRCEWCGQSITEAETQEAYTVDGKPIRHKRCNDERGRAHDAADDEYYRQVERNRFSSAEDTRELADHLIDSGDIPDNAPVTCHLCGAVVDGDALDVQTAADGSAKLDHFYCKAHLIAGTERLRAAIRAQREGQGA